MLAPQVAERARAPPGSHPAVGDPLIWSSATADSAMKRGPGCDLPRITDRRTGVHGPGVVKRRTNPMVGRMLGSAHLRDETIDGEHTSNQTTSRIYIQTPICMLGAMHRYMWVCMARSPTSCLRLWKGCSKGRVEWQDCSWDSDARKYLESHAALKAAL